MANLWPCDFIYGVMVCQTELEESRIVPVLYGWLQGSGLPHKPRRIQLRPKRIITPGVTFLHGFSYLN